MAIPLSARPGLPKDDPESTWIVGVEVDLATALALARASTKAMLELSPLAHREIAAALAHEIDVLEIQRDPLSLAAAQALKQYLPEAA
ncbi:hypothetical protein JKL49_01925 [Phenylobacterium sp. 20VBR1]|uniref:Uncharacterized protein n=1 Tax=Phenylobacterium glaciei TaxID=2803784 RepID=A0A941CXF7_9CAUL|nr:hypothetical protein [Phenylobacterium glaciei]MBR7618132.1 hypothetical protein [Phenylobacterium glaciei]